MKVLLAHPGVQHAPRLARELEQRGLLSEFQTGFAISADGPAARLARTLGSWPLVGGIRNRIVPGVGRNHLRTQAFNEIRAILELKLGAEPHRTIHRRNACFQAAISDSSLINCDAVVGFDTSSWLLAERARTFGKPFWLDRTIGHPAVCAEILSVLQQDFPQWARATGDRPAEVTTAEEREHALAHAIVVGSSFARDTLVQTGISAERIRINPYGTDWAGFSGAARPERHAGLRFLFVGSVQARKGVPYLLEAWRRLAPRNAELWLAGALPSDPTLVPGLPGLKLLGRVPHDNMPALFAQVDVFVLPSLFEGFSLALIEALASGLKIIATPNTGAADVLSDPALGTLVKAGSIHELETALAQCLSSPPDRDRVRAAAAPLEQTFSWQAYGDRWANLLRETA